MRFGKLIFDVKKLFCPKCNHDFSKAYQIAFELYLDMVRQSKIQKEPQFESYVDIYKRSFVCPSCAKLSINLYKFTKIKNWIRLEQLKEA